MAFANWLRHRAPSASQAPGKDGHREGMRPVPAGMATSPVVKLLSAGADGRTGVESTGASSMGS